MGQSRVEREKAECKGTKRNKLAVNQAGSSKREGLILYHQYVSDTGVHTPEKQ